MSSLIFITLYGVSYGMLLFLISVGLVVTMGLMRVVNLAHGAFAAVGGYLAYFLASRWQVPFLASLALATIGVGLLGGLLEKIAFASLYRASELDQVLMTIGMMFICTAALNFFFGPDPLPTVMPSLLAGKIQLPMNEFPVYRLFIIATGGIVMVLLFLLFDYTNLGAQLKAAVGNRSMAQATGINVDRLFFLTFVLGAALAALGGAIGFAILPLEPGYPAKYLVSVLVVVALTGFGNIKSAWAWSLLVGVVDTACRYLIPEAGSYVVYIVLILILLIRGGSLVGRWAR